MLLPGMDSLLCYVGWAYEIRSPLVTTHLRVSSVTSSTRGRSALLGCSVLLGWTASCQPEIDPGAEPATALQQTAGGASRQAQTARIPRITAMSPPLASNLGGTTFTITGTSFAPGAQISIGGQPAAYSYVMSSTQISAIAASMARAAGAVAVKVTNPDGRQSERSDVLTLFNDNLALIALRNGVSLSYMQLAAVADLSGDGHPDLVLADNSRLRILVAGSRGEFSEGQTIPLSTVASGLVDVGDFNGDGKPDLIVNNGFGPPEVDVFINLGGGTFGAPLVTPVTTLYSFSAAYVADVNGDGRTDLVAAGQGMLGLFTVQSFLAGSDGRLGAPVITPLTQSLGSGLLRDVNGDGKVDLVAAAPGTSQLVWLAGRGDGGGVPHGPNFPPTRRGWHHFAAAVDYLAPQVAHLRL